MQISLKEIEEFLKEKTDDAKLLATQKRISGPMIQDYHKKLGEGKIPPPIKIENNLIIEGHHRYLAGMIFGKLPESIPWTAPFSVDKIFWKEIIVDEIDWRDP